MRQDGAFGEIRAGRPERGARAADELLAFVRARLDEAETKARDLLRTAQDVRLALQDPRLLGRVVPGWHSWPDVEAMCEGALRGIAAKRAIVTRWEVARNQVAVGAVNESAGYGPADPGWALRADSHELDARSLAAVWSDHPDYQPERALDLDEPGELRS